MKAIFYCDYISNRIVIHGDAATLQQACPADPDAQAGAAKWKNHFSATRPLSQEMALAWLKGFGRIDREQRLMVLWALTGVLHTWK